jgi:hypothetical protein
VLESYVITVIPTLVFNDEHRRELKSLQFVAFDGIARQEWSVANSDHLLHDFVKLVDGEARAIIEHLQHGKPVSLTGFFSLEEVRGKFGTSVFGSRN